MAKPAKTSPSLAWLALGELGRTDAESLAQSIPALTALAKQSGLDRTEHWAGVSLLERAVQGWTHFAPRPSGKENAWPSEPWLWELPALVLLQRGTAGWALPEAERARLLDHLLTSQAWHVLRAWCKQKDRPGWDDLLNHPVNEHGRLRDWLDTYPQAALALVEAGIPLSWADPKGETLLFRLPNALPMARVLVKRGLVASQVNAAGKTAAAVFAKQRSVRSSVDQAGWLRLCGTAKPGKGKEAEQTDLAFALAREGKLTRFRALVKEPLGYQGKINGRGPTLTLLDVAEGNVRDWLISRPDVRQFPLQSRLVQAALSYNPAHRTALVSAKEMAQMEEVLRNWASYAHVKEEHYEDWLTPGKYGFAHEIGIKDQGRWFQGVLDSLWSWLNHDPRRWLNAASVLAPGKQLNDLAYHLMPVAITARDKNMFGGCGMLLSGEKFAVTLHGTWHHRLMMGAWVTALAWKHRAKAEPFWDMPAQKNLTQRFVKLAKEAASHGARLSDPEWAPLLAQARRLSGDDNPLLIALAEVRLAELAQRPASGPSRRRRA